MPKLYLTDDFVLNARCPTDKDQEIFWDHPKTLTGNIRRGAVPGLGVRVTIQGHISFVHGYKFDGKRKRMTLGKPANMNVGSARILVNQRESKLLAGENPDVDIIRSKRKHRVTVQDIIQEFWDTKSADWTKNYRYGFSTHISRRLRPQPTVKGKRIKRATYKDFETLYGEMKAEDIKPLHVKEFLNQFHAAGSYNTAYGRLKAVFNWANRMQLIDMRNPVEPLGLKKSLRVRRDYSPVQIKAIARHIFDPVLQSLPEMTGEGLEKRISALAYGRALVTQERLDELRNFMGILMLTMARPNELKQAKFAHFDLEQLIWHKHNTKGIKLSKRAQEYTFRSIPIHPRVARIVQTQKALWPNADHVFPSHVEPNQPRENFKKQLANFKELDGVPEYFQLYDLKRIAISLMITGQGVSREAVSHYVDHRGNLETTLIYDLGFVDPLRPVAQRLGQLLELES